MSVYSLYYLEMFHEDSNDYVDEHKLSHKNEDDEIYRSYHVTDTAVVFTVA